MTCAKIDDLGIELLFSYSVILLLVTELAGGVPVPFAFLMMALPAGAWPGFLASFSPEYPMPIFLRRSFRRFSGSNIH